MKVGQMASYLPGALPDEAQAILAQLQAESVAMSYDRVREVIREELGGEPEALFDTFDPTPFAAASIGQVHRARLHGQEVAVKVQYPGIEAVLKSDLSTFGWMTKMGTFGLPIDAGALVEELRSRILEECDYTLEARNQRRIRALFSNDPDVHVPRVIAERSSRRVLTSEYVDAMRFSRFVAEGSRAAQDRAGEVIFRTCMSSLFRHGVYNGDPHPGNYLFHEDGRVTFLDFGCVRRFEESFIETWKDFARGMLDDDRAGFPARFRALGLVGREKGFDYDAQWEITRYLYLPFIQRNPHFTYTDEYVRKSYGLMLFENPNQRRTACPSEWLLLNRLQWGLNAVLAKLGATGAWPDHFGRAARAPFEPLPRWYAEGMSLADTLRRRLRAARGLDDCDLVLRNVRYLDVFTCAFVSGDVAIKDGFVVGLAPGLRGTREIDAKGAHLVPGFIDAHVHLESSLLVPESFQRAVLPRGTTAAVCDPHELANVLGVPGIQYFLDAARRLSLDLRVMVSSCVPATEFETNGGGILDATMLAPLLAHEKTLGLAEVMNVPGVLAGDPLVLDKLVAFDGRPLDGHAPLVTGQALSAYACAGITSCHESSELGEAQEKLRNGMAVWIREGSVAKDLDALAPLLTLATSTSIGFCTDDRNPLDIQNEGHVDHLVRSAIRRGVAPEVAYRASSWSVARHYGLAGPARSLTRVGAVAPGYRADLVLLDDVVSCAIRDVLVAGKFVREMEMPSAPAQAPVNTVRAAIPELRDLEGPAGMVHVIGARQGRILTDRHVMKSDAPGVSRLSVLERHGKGSKPANGYVTGFGDLQGAIASSVGHDSHNLCVVGKETSDMRTALAALASSGGGFCVVRGGAVIALLPLPIGGLMSLEEPETIARALETLHAASKAIGCMLPEPFLQLAFLSLPVIPSLKLTDRGLMDVDAFKLIDVRAA